MSTVEQGAVNEAIINGNEDGDGWEYFLKHLKDGCPIIAERHPLLRVKYRYFTFVSEM